MPVDVLSSLVHSVFSSLFSVRTLPIFCVPLFVDLFEFAFQCIRDSGVVFGTLMYDSEPCRSG